MAGQNHPTSGPRSQGRLPCNTFRVPTTRDPGFLDLLRQTSTVAVVLAVGELLALVLALGSPDSGPRWVYFGLASLAIQWVLVLTLACLYFARAWLARARPWTVALVALGLMTGITLMIPHIAHWSIYGEWSLVTRDWPQLRLRMVAICLAIGTMGMLALANYRNSLLAARRAEHARLQALQARVRPHFLFNTLNTGVALVRANPQSAESLLIDLAELFRAALASPRLVPLAEELQLARRYLEIEALRFGPRLELHWNVPDPPPQADIPILTIQPLVENAVLHGIEGRSDGGRIEVALDTAPGEVRIVVRNDLPDNGASPHAGHHVGLSAVRERLASLTEAGRLETGARDGLFVATVALPAPAQPAITS